MHQVITMVLRSWTQNGSVVLCCNSGFINSRIVRNTKFRKKDENRQTKPFFSGTEKAPGYWYNKLLFFCQMTKLMALDEHKCWSMCVLSNLMLSISLVLVLVWLKLKRILMVMIATCILDVCDSKSCLLKTRVLSLNLLPTLTRKMVH